MLKPLAILIQIHWSCFCDLEHSKFGSEKSSRMKRKTDDTQECLFLIKFYSPKNLSLSISGSVASEDSLTFHWRIEERFDLVPVINEKNLTVDSRAQIYADFLISSTRDCIRVWVAKNENKSIWIMHASCVQCVWKTTSWSWFFPVPLIDISHKHSHREGTDQLSCCN